MSKIIIIGVSHHNTLGMIRCVGFAGYRADLVLIDGYKSFLSKSKYLDKVYYIDSIDKLKSFFDTHYIEGNEKSIIISCTDQVESFLDIEYETLNNRFFFFNSGEKGLVTYYMNKQVQTQLAKENGISVPKSFEYSGDISEAIYPCLLKPVQSICGGKQVVICQNKNELKSGLSFFNSGDVVLVQQFLQKEHEIVVLGLSVNGNVSIPGYILKHRDFNGGTLYSTVKSINSLDSELVDNCKAMVRTMHYEGLFGIEFIYCNGRYYFIEINLRNDATTYALAVAGVNLPQTYIKAKVDGSELPKTYEVKELQSIVEFNDFKHRCSFGVSTIQWLKQFLNAKCKYYFCWKDPIPFFLAPFKR